MTQKMTIPRLSTTWAVAIIVAVLMVPLLYVFLGMYHTHTQEDQSVTVSLASAFPEHQNSDDDVARKADEPSFVDMSLDQVMTVTAEPSLSDTPQDQEPLPGAETPEEADVSLAELLGADTNKDLVTDALVNPSDHEHNETDVLAVTGETEMLMTGHPFVLYHREFVPQPDKVPLSLVITDIGYDPQMAHFIVDSFPEEVTSALVPIGDFTNQCAMILRENGREYMLMIPMEPLDYPSSNPGPQLLLTGVKQADNNTVFQSFLQQHQEYMGVMPYMGTRFVRSESDMRPFLQQVADLGLCYFENRSTRSYTSLWAPETLPYVKAQFDFPKDLSKAQVKNKLKSIQLVLERKVPVILTIEADLTILQYVKTWLDKSIPDYVEMAPLSAQMIESSGSAVDTQGRSQGPALSKSVP